MAGKIPGPLLRREQMVLPLVLDGDTSRGIREVHTGDDPPMGVADVEVELGLRESRIDEDQATPGLARRS